MNRSFGRTFWAYFATLFISAFNDNVFKNALVVLIAYKNQSVWGLDGGSVVALAGGLFMLPYFIFSPLAGQLADQIDKARLIRVTKLAEIFIMIAAALGFYFESFGFLLAMLFFAGAQAAFFGPVKYGIIPELIAKDDLVRANAAVEAGTFIAILAGTLLGGALAATGEVVPLMATLILIAIAGWWVSAGVEMQNPATPWVPLRFNPAPGMRTLWRTLRRDHDVWYATVAISWFWFLGAATLSILPALGKETLNATPGVVTMFLALFTIGIGLGSFIGERAARGRFGPNLVTLGAVGTTAFGLELYAATRAYVRPLESVDVAEYLSRDQGGCLGLAFTLMAIAGGVFILPLYTLVQRRARADERARVIAANNVMNAVFMVAASSGLILARNVGLDHAQTFGALAILNALTCGLILWRAPGLSAPRAA